MSCTLVQQYELYACGTIQMAYLWNNKNCMMILDAHLLSNKSSSFCIKFMQINKEYFLIFSYFVHKHCGLAIKDQS